MTQEPFIQPEDPSGLADGPALCGRRRFGWLRWCGFSLALVVVLVLGGAGLFAWTLHRDQNSAFLREQLLGAVTKGLGEGQSVAVAEAGLRFAGLTSTFTVGGLTIAAGNGLEASLRRAEVEVSTLSLWRKTPVARNVRFEGLRLVLPEAGNAENPVAAHEALAVFRAVLAAAHFAGTGQDPTFSALDAIAGSQIEILQRQPGGGASPLQSGLALELIRQGQDGMSARLTKAGSPIQLALKAGSRPMADGGTMMMLDSDEIDIRTVEALTGSRLAWADPKLKLRLTMHSRRNAEGVIVEKGARINAYGGVITPADRDMVPFLLDEASVELRMRPGVPDILLDRIRVRFNETHFVFSGALRPDNDAQGALRLQLRAERADIDRLSPGEAPTSLDAAELDALVAPNLRSLRVERFEIREDEGKAVLSGLFSLDEGGVVENRLVATNLHVRKALRIWPIWVAAPVRRWMIQHAESGKLAELRLDMRLAGQALVDAQEHRPIPDDAMRLSYRLEDLRLRPLRDAPAISGIAGRGSSTGRRSEATIESAYVEPQPGQRFQIRDARLLVANTALRPSLLEMTLPAEGRLDALMAVLSAPSLRDVAGLPPDAAVSDGQFQGQATLAIPLSATVQAKDIRTELRADLRQVAIDNLVKGERLENGTFALLSRNGSVNIKGEGRLFGVSQQIELKSEPGKGGQAIAKAQLDETVLARRGIDLRPAVQGPMQATITLPLTRNASGYEVEIDLARTRIETGIPGLAKRAGQAGRVRFTVANRTDGATLDNLELDLAPAALRGKVELARDGQFVKADFSSFKLSAGDNARLQAEKHRGVTRLVLRGNAFDLRPFLRGFQAGKIEEGRSADAKAPDIDLDLQTTVLIGFNGELMGGVDTKVARRQGRVTQLSLKGQFGGAPVVATSSEGQRDTTLVNATAQDGGALLRFLDIYGKVYGGRLSSEIFIGAQTQQGIVQIRDFTIRGESALRQVGASGRTISSTQDLGDEVLFTKMRADFARRPGRLDLREAVMWGSQLGGTLEGTLDYGADRVDLKGVFVPAYALNNFFASVPVLGPILGGSQYEGLFAVPFVINGRASAPVMRINPVSALAPGFLRKFFELQREGSGAGGASRPIPSRGN